MAHDDQPSNEVGIAASWSSTGISVSLKSRAIAYFDRLIGGKSLAKIAVQEGEAALIKAGYDAKRRIMEAQTESAVGIVSSDPKFGEKLVDRFMTEEAAKQINREAVAVKYIEHLKESPQEEDSTPAAEAEADDDWMNVYVANAEKASSERLRDLWGRVLSGQVRHPGSFSLPTLRFIAELDEKTAATFEKYVEVRFPTGEVFRPHNFDSDQIADLSFLEAIGLIYGFAADHLLIQFSSNEDKSISLVFGDMFLRVTAKESNHLYKLHVMHLTRIGKELLEILPPPNYALTAREIVARLDGEIDHAERMRVVERLPDSTFKLTLEEKLK